jgi:hypothetical protein
MSLKLLASAGLLLVADPASRAVSLSGDSAEVAVHVE